MPATVITNTIGGVAPDYATIDAWNTATALNPLGSNTIYLGLLRSGTYTNSNYNGTVGFGGSTSTGPTNYREIRYATNVYDPATEVGPVMVITADGVVITESNFRFTGIGIDNAKTTAGGNDANLLVSANACIVDSVASFTSSNLNIASTAYIFLQGDSNIVRNCIVGRFRGWSNSSGHNRTIDTSSGTNNRYENCVSWNNRNAGMGFQTTGNEIVNCISVENAGTAYVGLGGNTMHFCLSDDTSAAGTNSLTEYGNTNDVLGVLVNPTNGNFRLTATTDANNQGLSLSNFFTLDYTQSNSHNADSTGWEFGAYDSGSQPGPVTNVAIVGMG